MQRYTGQCLRVRPSSPTQKMYRFFRKSSESADGSSIFSSKKVAQWTSNLSGERYASAYEKYRTSDHSSTSGGASHVCSKFFFLSRSRISQSSSWRSSSSASQTLSIHENLSW